MLEGKCIAICINEPGRGGCLGLVERLASVGMMAGCQSNQSFQQNWIFQTQRDEASEWILVAVIYNKELANAFIISSCCQSIVQFFELGNTLTVVNIVFG